MTGASVATARPVAQGFDPSDDGHQRAGGGSNARPSGGVPGEEFAMAIPRLPMEAPGGASGDDGVVALPRPLSPEMATLVRSIFRLQRQGAFAEALSSTTRLTDTTLLADVVAERFVNPAYLPTAGELQRWLRAHSDMADAPAIYARLSAMSDRGVMPVAPSAAILGGSRIMTTVNELSGHPFARNVLLDRTVQERAAQGMKGAQSAMHLIAITPGMTPPYAAQLGGEVAQTLLSLGDAGNALLIARDAFGRGEKRVGFPAYIGGLAAWALDRRDEAVVLFETASRAALVTPDLVSASAFWAARGHRDLGEQSAFRPWLQRALASRTSFYGLLAQRLLDREPRHAAEHDGVQNADLEMVADTAPSMPVLTEVDIDAVATTPVGNRVFALLQVGEQGRAEMALRRYWPKVVHDTPLARSMQLVAAAAGLNDLSLEMADSIQAVEQASGLHGEQLPLPALHPRHGFTVDPALVYALTRLESNFDPQAVSGAGAHGLMQIQPVTAGFVTGQASRFTGSPEVLHDPGLNLEIGQRYVRYLAHLTTASGDTASTGVPPEGGDLIRLLASYNAGPGAISRWEAASGASSDPLLYMERLPNPQTRAYVAQAFSYLWTYADRLSLPTPSLEALTLGHWPGFRAELQLAAARWPSRTIH
nr:transglycosylase SLT domain-containing protein [Acetobacter fallax]